MSKLKNRTTQKQLAQIILVILLSLTVIQTIQVTRAQNSTSNNQWALGFQILNNQNVTNNVFTPFDEIQLFANVTYGNATQPDILITFKVQGPSNSSDPINITRIATTNANGIAACSFHLPVSGQNQDSVIGTWQASATIQTTNGTLQQAIHKNLTFTTQWNLEITSLNIQSSQDQNQTIFYPSNTAKVLLSINNKGPAKAANISLTLQDSAGRTINQTQILNTQISANSTGPTQIQGLIQIPNNAITGEATINAAIYSGSFQDINLPDGENKTAYFTIAANTAPTPTPNLPPNSIENSVSLFSWVLIATGLFTFTLLFVFLKRKPALKINTQIPICTTSTPSPTMTTSTQPQQLTTSQASPIAPTPKIAQERTINATLTTQMPNIYETLGIPTPEPSSPQEQKQTVIDHLTKISSINQRVQDLETKLKIEREQLNKEITDLNKTLEEQEKAVKNYFDSIRQEIAKINPNQNNGKQDIATPQKKLNQEQDEKDDEN